MDLSFNITVGQYIARLNPKVWDPSARQGQGVVVQAPLVIHEGYFPGKLQPANTKTGSVIVKMGDFRLRTS